jgi:hypothetical protein
VRRAAGARVGATIRAAGVRVGRVQASAGQEQAGERVGADRCGPSVGERKLAHGRAHVGASSVGPSAGEQTRDEHLLQAQASGRAWVQARCQ